MSNPLVIVVKNGMVQEVYCLKPCRTEIEIIDLEGGNVIQSLSCGYYKNYKRACEKYRV